MGLRDKFKKLSDSRSESSSNSNHHHHQGSSSSYNNGAGSSSSSNQYQSSSFNSGSYYPDEKKQGFPVSNGFSPTPDLTTQLPQFDTNFSTYIPNHNAKASDFVSTGNNNNNNSNDINNGGSYVNSNYGSSSSATNTNINETPDYAPPPGPPPSYREAYNASTSSSANVQSLPPQYRPSPSSHFQSLYSHAPDDECDLGNKFTDMYPIYPPRFIVPEEQQEMEMRRLKLVAPPMLITGLPKKVSFENRFHGGEIREIPEAGGSFISSKYGTTDTLFVSNLPIYSPHLRDTFQGTVPGGQSNFYFEALITSIDRPEEAGIAIGYTCLPYPHFRLPGWHRGSLAVHSDDGRRYVNDSLSGKDFTSFFGSSGTVVGIGMNLERMTVYFTRNGKFEKEWSLIEDMNAKGVDPNRQFRDGGIEGLQGDRDIYATVGVFGQVSAQINLNGPFKYRG